MAHLNVVGPYYLVKAIEDENEKVAFYQKSKQGWINVFSDAIYYESILKELYTEILNEL